MKWCMSVCVCVCVCVLSGSVGGRIPVKMLVNSEYTLGTEVSILTAL